MGFVPKKTTYRLSFEDPEMAGLEVVMSSATMGDMLSAASPGDGQGPEQLRTVVDMISKALISWNVETESGDPVPPEPAGLMAMESSFVMALMKAWTTAVAGVAAPLEQGSTSGATLPELSLPMEALSPNQGS